MKRQLLFLALVLLLLTQFVFAHEFLFNEDDHNNLSFQSSLNEYESNFSEEEEENDEDIQTQQFSPLNSYYCSRRRGITTWTCTGARKPTVEMHAAGSFARQVCPAYQYVRNLRCARPCDSNPSSIPNSFWTVDQSSRRCINYVIPCPKGASYSASLGKCIVPKVDVCPSGGKLFYEKGYIPMCEAPKIPTKCSVGSRLNNEGTLCMAEPVCPAGTSLIDRMYFKCRSNSRYSMSIIPNTSGAQCAELNAKISDNAVSVYDVSKCDRNSVEAALYWYKSTIIPKIVSPYYPSSPCYNAQYLFCAKNCPDFNAATQTCAQFVTDRVCPNGFSRDAYNNCVRAPDVKTCPPGFGTDYGGPSCFARAKRTCPPNSERSATSDNCLAEPQCPSGAYARVGGECHMAYAPFTYFNSFYN